MTHQRIYKIVSKLRGLPTGGTLNQNCTIDANGNPAWTTAAGGGDMLKADNLSGLASYDTARTNLGKDATGGLAGLTLFKINFKNVANTFISFFTNANTAERTYTFQDRNGTIADNTDLENKQATLVSGTNIKTVNGSTLLGSGNLTVSASITETEIDLGTTPLSEASIAVTDATVATTSKILGGVAYKAPTGKDLDELEMDAIDIKFQPGTGTFNVIIKGLEGYLADRFIIWYQVAA